MSDFLIFLANHWFLWFCWLFLLMAIIWFYFWVDAGGVVRLSPQEIVRAINQEKAILLDIRSKTEYDAGHILGSKNIASEAILDENNRYVRMKEKRNFIIIHKQENQALKIAIMLKAKGFQKVGVLKGGIPAWIEENLPFANSSSSDVVS